MLPKNKNPPQGISHKFAPKEEHYLGIKPLPPEPEPDRKVVSFEVKIPHLSVPKPFKEKLNKKMVSRTVITATALLLIAGILYGIGALINKPQTKPDDNSVLLETPGETDGAINNSSKGPSKDVVTLADKIAGADVTVTKQPLPNSFKGNPEQELEKQARNLKATTVVYAGEVKAFSTKMAENLSQRVMFIKNDLLIFIYSKKGLDRDGLVQYIIDLD